MSSIQDKFIELFGVPEVALPHLNVFAADDEMELIVAMDGQGMTPGELAKKMDISEKDALDLMEKSYFRFILHKDKQDENVYLPAVFDDRLNHCCKFDENYPKIPKEIRDGIEDWLYTKYKTSERVKKLIRGEMDKAANLVYLDIAELDEFMADAKRFRIVPCDCRNLKDTCKKPRETCIRFDDNINERTFGREISKEEAKEIILNAHKKGLMLQVNTDWRENGATGVCNCCACCCYPVRAAVEYESKGTWPLVENIALYDETSCIHCGRCVRRCNFGVFTFGEEKIEVNGKMRKKIVYNPELCWGCSLCATTCPTKSITMKKLDA